MSDDTRNQHQEDEPSEEMDATSDPDWERFEAKMNEHRREVLAAVERLKELTRRR
jgi:hypothetical protein